METWIRIIVSFTTTSKLFAFWESNATDLYRLLGLYQALGSDSVLEERMGMGLSPPWTRKAPGKCQSMGIELRSSRLGKHLAYKILKTLMKVNKGQREVFPVPVTPKKPRSSKTGGQKRSFWWWTFQAVKVQICQNRSFFPLYKFKNSLSWNV